MTTDIAPALGHGALFTQAGVGAGPGYDMIDLRRFLSVGRHEGPVASGAYKVSQRASGANMSVDIAASAGPALVQGDSVTEQGLYYVPAHTAVINEAITAAHATLPRLDQVTLEVLDDTHAGGGNNKSRVRVINGTATSGATLDNRTGAAALPATAIRLADVLVPAADSTISDGQIRDRRPMVPSIIAAEESRTNTSYGLLTTADQVEVVLPTDGLIVVSYRAQWKSSIAGNGRAAIFLGSSQLQVYNEVSTPTIAVQEAATRSSSAANVYRPLLSSPVGVEPDIRRLGGTTGSDIPAFPTTGLALAGHLFDSSSLGGSPFLFGGACVIEAAPGTYTVSVQFKATSGSVTAKERKLWVQAHPLGA